MPKILLIVAGAANLFFVFFHVLMGYQLQQTPELAEGVRGLLETFNAGATLALALLAFVFLVRGKEVLNTGLGAAVLVYAAMLYLSRAVEEFVWLGGSLKIAAACVALGLLHGLLLLWVRIPRQAVA